MASLGDSITRAYNTGPSAYQDYPAGSWSTGTIATSHATRLSLAATSVFNDAVSGTKMFDLARQAGVANARGVGYITILMGGNDICTRTTGEMTDPALFGRQFNDALSAISPGTRVFVASIPNVTNLLTVLKGNASARFIWSIFGICQSLLARPTSTLPADAARRKAVSDENVALNAQLAAVCSQFANCLFDGLAVYNTVFVASDVSTRDYFHPSPSGQKKLACATWAVSYWPGVKPGCL
ncbi:MAG: GDSL-type esterase/lipase family protein [Chloroflexota bacterium]|nr:GDSL-type esterase/lipase family protein [Chloroflexota bacterium]